MRLLPSLFILTVDKRSVVEVATWRSLIHSDGFQTPLTNVPLQRCCRGGSMEESGENLENSRAASKSAAAGARKVNIEQRSHHHQHHLNHHHYREGEHINKALASIKIIIIINTIILIIIMRKVKAKQTRALDILKKDTGILESPTPSRVYSPSDC